MILDDIPAIVAGLGAGGFAPALLRAGHDRLGAFHLSAFLFDADLVPCVVLASSFDGGDLAAQAATNFTRHRLYEVDPLRPVIGAGSGESAPMVQRFSPHDPAAAEGQRRFYDKLGLTQRLTIVGVSALGWLSVNFYRTAQSAPLGEQAFDDLVRHAAVIHALVARHVELTASAAHPRETGEVLRQRLALLDGALTPRETEVCLHALQGATNAEIAVAMKIEPTTVSTLRHRAYERLDVSNIVELFLKCLSVGP